MKIKLPLTLFCLFLISCEKGDIEIFDSKPIFSSSLNGEWILVNENIFKIRDRSQNL